MYNDYNLIDVINITRYNMNFNHEKKNNIKKAGH